MSVKDDLTKVGQDLGRAQGRLSIAGGVMAAAMAVAKIMNKDEALVWQVIAGKQMIKITNHYIAGILAAADQLGEELKGVNNA